MVIEPYIIGDLLEKLSTVCFAAYLLTRTKGAFNFIRNEKSWQYILIISIIFGVFYAFGYYSGTGSETSFLSIKKIGPNMAGLLAGPIGGVGAAIVGLLIQSLDDSPMIPAVIIPELFNGIVCGIIYLLNSRRLIRVWQAGILGFCLIGADTTISWLISQIDNTTLFYSPSLVIIEMGIIALSMSLFTMLIQNVTRERERNSTACCLEGQVQAAREIQQGYLPTLLTGIHGCSIAAKLIPMYEVGGDFYDFRMITPSKLYFCIGDVAGKGVSAAFVMASSLTLLRNAILYSDKPGEILSQVNRGLIMSSHDCLFVTMFVGIMDLSTGKVTCSSAGHPPPLLITHSSTRILTILPDIPAGTWDDYQYQQEEFMVLPGDQLVLYTDGVIECENEQGMFGIDPVLREFTKNPPPDPEKAVETITRMVFAYTKTGTPSDDLTLLAISRDPDR
ncbi:MAG TPA: SpoIIE family protein phosphatase [Methanospirillum sp.]|nr:SpoIIE family protein phosphatase [Methanospirillum sp.]